MGKRLTHEQVETAFSQAGYQLLSQYKNQSHVALQTFCPKGHEWKVSRSNFFNNGRRCPLCTGKVVTKETAVLRLAKTGQTLVSEFRPAPAKLTVKCEKGHTRQNTLHNLLRTKCRKCYKQGLTHEQAMDRFKKAGFKVLSDNRYINNTTPFQVQCSNKHVTTKTISHVDTACRVCAKTAITYGMIKEQVEANDYKLLSKSYTNAHAKLHIECTQGHQYFVRWNGFQQGTRCPHCSGHIVTPEQVESAFSKEGWTLLERYEKGHNGMSVVCSAGHHIKKSWTSFASGKRCAICDGQVVTHDEVEAALNKEGYTLLSKYKNSHSRIDIICPEGHRHKISWKTFRRGHRCGRCSNGGFDFELPGILYYIRFDTNVGHLYKIGITNSCPATRFKKEPTKYTVLTTKGFLFGYMAYEEEQSILKRYSHHKYKGPDVLISGNSELFTKDVLNLDS